MPAELITIVTAIGAFCVSSLSIYVRYLLFIAGATGTFKFRGEAGKVKVGLESVAPGLGFALFGMFVALYALHKLIAGGW
jgi:hypothetical protein